MVKVLRVLSKTIGVKLLYSSDTATELKMLPELIGRIDTRFHGTDKEIAAEIPAIVCKAIGFQIINKPKLKYAIGGKITFKEEKVVV